MNITYLLRRVLRPHVIAMLACCAGPAAALAAEVNLYTTREPGLIQPLLDKFSQSTGIKVNTVFVRDGLAERVAAEGRRSPADVLMAVDIGKSLIQNLAAEGVSFSAGRFRSLVVAYSRLAGDTIRQYGADAAINHLSFDRHQEGLAVDTFVRSLQLATHEFMDDPLGAPLIPNWNRVLSAVPDLLERMADAVDNDAADARMLLAGKGV